ncbi:MAG: hypothetical protein U0805_10370 [Pirellulales bacterium]
MNECNRRRIWMEAGIYHDGTTDTTRIDIKLWKASRWASSQSEG